MWQLAKVIESFKNNVEIKNLENLKLTNSKQIFHAGTIKNEKGKILSNGGRVLNSTVVSETLKNARIEALDLLDQLDWENKYYRRDIGFRVIKMRIISGNLKGKKIELPSDKSTRPLKDLTKELFLI